MRRREFIALAGGAAVWPIAVRAQQQGQRPALIGWLSFQSHEAGGHLLVALKEGLATLGWREGTQFILEERWADGRFDRLQQLAEELAAIKPKIIVAFPGQPVRAVAQAARDTPIVFAATADPVAAGLVKSFAHPGGMITGISNLVQDVTEKHLELLTAALPELRRVGFLADSTNTNTIRAQLREAADRSVVQYKVGQTYEEVARPAEIDAAISRLADGGAQALVVIASPILVSERQRILRLAATRRWPVIGWSREWPADGALMSYGVNTSDSLRRAAYYIDKILKGANPGDLPVEQPTKIELVINLKTAKALGITVPPSLLARADEVIE
jgi:putative ABC transport system substrate-binding protein